jgi:acyl carrier protein
VFDMHTTTELALPAGPVADRLRAALGKRLRNRQYDAATSLVQLGIDSLTLLRIIADVATDPDQEIDPADLAELSNVRDLYELLAGWQGGA